MRLIRMKVKDTTAATDSKNACKNFRKDDETCSTGCKELDIFRGGGCPFETNEEAQVCPCYTK